MPAWVKASLWLHRHRILAQREHFERQCRSELSPDSLRKLLVDMGESEYDAAMAEARYRMKQQEDQIDG